MWLTIICIIITVLGSIFEYRNSISESNKSLFKFSKYILLFGILGLIGNNIKQEIDSNTLSKNFNNIRNDNQNLSNKFDSTKHKLNVVAQKYDSLKFHYQVINNKLEITEKQLLILGNKTDRGFQNNESYLKSIDTKNLERQRILSSNQIDLIYNELLKFKKTEILIDYPEFGDQENAKYTEYFIKVFRKAGWVVQTRSIIGGSDNNMTEVNIILKSTEYEPKKEIYNCLYRAFEKAGLKFKFRIDPKMKSDDEIRLHINEG